jgi:phage terminase small subunit
MYNLKDEFMAKKQLSKRREKFVEEMANPRTRTQTEAYQKAYGCSYDTARANAPQLLANASISEAIKNRIKRAMKHHAVTPEEVLGSAVFQMRTSMDDLIDEDGSFDLEKARTTGAIDVVKKLEIEEITDFGTGNIIRKTKVELLLSESGRKEVANYIGMEQAPRTNDTSAQDIVLLVALKTIREMMSEFQLSFDDAVREYFGFIRPDHAPVREKVTQQLLSEMVI